MDSTPAALLPFSLIYNHNLYLDQFVKYFQVPGQKPLYFWGFARGHWYSAYPVVLPIIISPLYWLVLKMLSFNSSNIPAMIAFANFMEKFSASLVAALSVSFIFLLLRKTNKQYALFLTFTYAFATSTWVISSQALWQHGLSQLFIILALLTFYQAQENDNYLYLSGLFASLAVAERYPNFIFALFMLVLVFYIYRQRVIKFVLPCLLVGPLLLGYNLYVYGSIKGGYILPFKRGIFEGLSLLFFYPNKGLFIYTPVTIFSFLGIYFFLKRYKLYEKLHIKSIYLVSIGSIISGSILLSKWPGLGGSSYGPRFFTDLLPFFVILLVPFIEGIVLIEKKAKKLVISLFVLAVLFSFLVQVIGAFFYSGVDGPANSSFADWRSSQIVKAIRLGPYTRPYIDFAYQIGWLKQNELLPATALKAKIKIKSGRSKLKVGELSNYLIEITNTSKEIWPRGWDSSQMRSILITSFFINSKGDAYQGISWLVSKSLRPNQKIDMDFLAEAPSKPGKYTLKFDLQQEFVVWFNQPTQLRVQVSALR